MANRSSNRAAVPEAKGALDKFKYEVASELGVPLTDGYNGDLTSSSRKNRWQANNIVFSIKKLVPITKKKTSGIDPDVFF